MLVVLARTGPIGRKWSFVGMDMALWASQERCRMYDSAQSKSCPLTASTTLFQQPYATQRIYAA